MDVSHHYDQFYIGGRWVAPSTTRTCDVIDSSTEEAFATIPLGTEVDVDAAVRAAAVAFPSWSQTTIAERKDYLDKLCDGIEERAEDLAHVISRELGMPIRLANLVQVGTPLGVAQSMVELADQIVFSETVPNDRDGGCTRIVREAYGVVSCITPWNYPLNQIATKVFPALLAGCTVVLKPSEVAPLDANILAEIFHEIGLPAGVFNLVHGSGVEVGEPMCTHPLVDMVSFTGSTRAGKRVAQLAASNIKKCKLELGGKSAHILLDDANIEKTVAKSMMTGLLINSGQTCSALTRLLVPRAKQAEVVAAAKKVAESTKIGDGSDQKAFMGPLISKRQQDTVRGFIERGIEEGATLVTGGTAMPNGFTKGYFVRPTVFSNVSNSMSIAQEEIFGPVLCIIPYDSEDEAVAIANDSPYGLSGAVTSRSIERASEVALRVRTGEMSVNGGSYNPIAPFGGYKQSGIGREKGVIGINEFLQVKAINIPQIKSKI